MMPREVVGNKREDIAVAADDERDFITWGGDSLDNDPALIAKKIRQGSSPPPARARSVVIVGSVVDTAATEALRATMQAARGSTIPLFNYGPGIDNLRANAKAETGLAAMPASRRRWPPA